jgi:hypothetical protein
MEHSPKERQNLILHHLTGSFQAGYNAAILLRETEVPPMKLIYSRVTRHFGAFTPKAA